MYQHCRANVHEELATVIQVPEHVARTVDDDRLILDLDGQEQTLFIHAVAKAERGREVVVGGLLTVLGQVNALGDGVRWPVVEVAVNDDIDNGLGAGNGPVVGFRRSCERRQKYQAGQGRGISHRSPRRNPPPAQKNACR